VQKMVDAANARHLASQLARQAAVLRTSSVKKQQRKNNFYLKA